MAKKKIRLKNNKFKIDNLIVNKYQDIADKL